MPVYICMIFLLVIGCIFTTVATQKHITFYQIDNVTSDAAETWCASNASGRLTSEETFTLSNILNGTVVLAENTFENFAWLGNSNGTQQNCDDTQCYNGGYCMVNGTEELCLCKRGFSGTLCEIENCLRTGCENNGSCIHNGTNFVCHCVDNYFGQHCEHKGCTQDRCYNGGTCYFAKTQVYCLCEKPYYGQFCEMDKYTYIGCYQDNADRLLELDFTKLDEAEPYSCLAACVLKGYIYAGLEAKTECFCGNKLNEENKIDNTTCFSECPGDAETKCGGGSWAISIYKADLKDDKNESNVYNRLSCSFDPNESCFLSNVTNAGNHWYRSFSDENYYANYVSVEKNYGATDSRAILGAPISSNIPKCLLFSNKQENNGRLEIYIVHSDEKLPNTTILTIDREDDEWKFFTAMDLHPTHFSMVLLAGVLSGTTLLGDVRLEDGYCECRSSVCFPGMICMKKRGRCCRSAEECSYYEGSIPEMKALKCTFKTAIPCFMTSENNKWERRDSSLVLNGVYPNRVNDSLYSFILPKDSKLCFKFTFHKYKVSGIEVSQRSLYEKHVLTYIPYAFERRMTVQIPVFSRDQTQLFLTGMADFGQYAFLSLKEIQLYNTTCTVDHTTCNKVIVQNEGRISLVVQSYKNVCEWMIQVSPQASILLYVDDFNDDMHCKQSHVEILNSTGEVYMTMCGGNVTIDDNIVILRIVKNMQKEVHFKAQWKQVLAYCPALHIGDQVNTVVDIPCQEHLDSLLCESDSEPDMLLKETNVMLTSPRKADDIVIIVSSASGILLLIVVLFVLIVVVYRRKRLKPLKDGILYNNKTGNIDFNNPKHVQPEEDAYDSADLEMDESYSHRKIDVKNTNQSVNIDISSKYDHCDEETSTVKEKPDGTYDHFTLKASHAVRVDDASNDYGRLDNSYGVIQSTNDLENDMYDHTVSNVSHVEKDDIYMNTASANEDDMYDSTSQNKYDKKESMNEIYDHAH